MFLHIRLHLHATLFPYTTLFRSHALGHHERHVGGRLAEGAEHETGRLVEHDLEGLRVDDGQLLHEAHHRSEEHTSELQSLTNLVCRLLLEKKNARSCEGPRAASE